MKSILAVAIALGSWGIMTANAIAQLPTYPLHEDLENPDGGLWHCNVRENPWLYIQPLQEVPCLQVFPELGLGEAEPLRAPSWNYPGIDYSDASNAEFLPQPLSIAELISEENTPFGLNLISNSNIDRANSTALKTNVSLQISHFDTTATTWFIQQQSLTNTNQLTFELAASESIDREIDDRSLRLHLVNW
ncbi:MAG: hypothetical protein SAJ12_12870 [Jaaginema sp. PMC 1079.18]|nr:hypothetical protein [Jaaginema sp. PMC 1080.18]MEC4851898.1 hypothetical protein [Jaaginema sp. PMC 1079.18]MEC4865220.1 hypothetical protein [Jaaginema sp. PMC 1078.18]